MIRMDDDLSYILTFFAALAGNWCRCPLLHAGAFNWTYTLGVGLIE